MKRQTLLKSTLCLLMALVCSVAWAAVTLPQVSTDGAMHFYRIKSFRTNKYAAYTGDASQLAQTAEFTNNTVWYVTADGENYKLHNIATDNVYASYNSFTATGATVYIKENPYKAGYVCVSTTSDLSRNCWDDQSNQTRIGNYNPRQGDAEGTSWTFEEVTSSTYTFTVNETTSGKAYTGSYTCYEGNGSKSLPACVKAVGVSYTNAVWGDQTFTADITFSVPVERETLIYPFKNTDIRYYVDGSNVKATKTAPTLGDGGNYKNYLWKICPEIVGDNFVFKIKNVGAGDKCVYATKTDGANHGEGDVTVSSENATVFTMDAENRFVCATDKGLRYLSIGSSTSPNHACLFNTTHDGTKNAFQTTHEVTKYKFTDAAGNVFEGIYEGIAGLKEPTITGANGYSLSNKVWNGDTFEATITFVFPTSKIDGATNQTMISSFGGNSYKWHVEDGKYLRTDKNIEPALENLNLYYWAIYPTLNNGGFTFKVKNIGTGDYIYSESSSASHDKGVVTFNNEGSAMTFEANNRFKLPTNQCLSLNSSGGDDGQIQYVGTHEGHGGCNLAFPTLSAYTVTTDANGYAAIYSPVAVTIPTDITSYAGRLRSTKKTLVLSKVSTTIPAENAVILKGAASTSYTFSKVNSGTAIPNDLKGSATNITAVADAYIFNAADATFTKTEGNVNAYAAYLEVSGAADIISTFVPEDITSLDEVENYSFQVHGQRGFIYVNDQNQPAALNNADGNTNNDVAYDAVNDKHHYAVVKYKENYYLYSIGAQKFLIRNGDNGVALADRPADAVTIESSGNATYPWIIKLGGLLINISNGGGHTNSIRIAGESNPDEGARWALCNTGAFDASSAHVQLAKSEAKEQVQTMKLGGYCLIDKNGNKLSNITAANAAIDAATTVEEVNDLLASCSLNLPTPGKAYYLKDNHGTYLDIHHLGSWSGTAGSENTLATMSATKQLLYITGNEEDGTWKIHTTAEGGNYLHQSSTIGWNSKVSSDGGGFKWEVEGVDVSGTPHYMLKNISGQNNGYLGADSHTAGNALYVDQNDAAKKLKMQLLPVKSITTEFVPVAAEWLNEECVDVASENVPAGAKFPVGEDHADYASYKSSVVTSGEYFYLKKGCLTGLFNWRNNSGNKRVNIVAVEVVDLNDAFVAADYHYGYAGNPSSNNTYTVDIPEDGLYYIRYYAEKKTNGGVNNSDIDITYTYMSKRIVKQDLYNTSNGSIEVPPYRIPGITVDPETGRIITTAARLVCGTDPGYGQVDVVCRISDNHGDTWSEMKEVAVGTGITSPTVNYFETAFGDPAVVADRTSDEVLIIVVAGCTKYQTATRQIPNEIGTIHSLDNGNTWGKPVRVTEQIYSLFDAVNGGNPIESAFVGGGKIFQSRIVKVGNYYRLYAAMCARPNGNRVIYSDDFGRTWHALGGASALPAPGGDEPKCEEMPDGRVILSSRTGGGRIYNIYTYTNTATAEGSWEGAVTSTFEGSGKTHNGQSTNGEILIVPVVRNSDQKEMYLTLQSLPAGGGRSHVGIFYKELTDMTDINTVANFAIDWNGYFEVTDKTSAYSSMDLQKDGRIGFIYEENYTKHGEVSNPHSIDFPNANNLGTHNYDGYDNIYVAYPLEFITNNAYSIKGGVDRREFLRSYFTDLTADAVAVDEVKDAVATKLEGLSTEPAIDEVDNIYFTISKGIAVTAFDEHAGKAGFFTNEAVATYKTEVMEATQPEGLAEAKAKLLASKLNIVSGKAYTFKNVQKDGTTVRWYKYDTEQGKIVLTATEDEATPFVCRLLNNGKYVFVCNDGKYMTWRASVTGYTNGTGVNDAYHGEGRFLTDITIAKMTAGANINGDLSNTRYVSISAKRPDKDETGYVVVKKNNGSPTFDGAGAAYYNDNFSSAFIMEEAAYANTPKLNSVGEGELLSANLHNKYMGTFSAPFPTVVPEGVTAYYATKGNGYVTLNAIAPDNAIAANTGVILVGEDAGNAVMVPAAAETVATTEGNLLAHSAGADKDMTEVANAYYQFVNGDQGMGFYKFSGGTLPMNEAYLQIDDDQEAIGIRFVVKCNIGDYKIATFYANDAMNIPSGVKAYVATTAPVMDGVNGIITMTEIMDGIIPAKTGAVLRGEPGDYTFEPATEAGGTEVTGNLLHGYAGIAEYETVDLPNDGSTNYVLTVKNDKVAFYRKEDGFKVYNNKAYLNVPGSNVQARALYFNFDNDATGIVETENESEKTEIYDLAGRRVQKVQKGLYIVNGKKVLK